MTIRRVLISIVCWLLLPEALLPAQQKIPVSRETAAENAVLEAVADYNAGRYEKAASTLEQVVNAVPGQDAAHYWLALCDIYMNKVDEAEAHLSKAVELDSSSFWYRQRLASLYVATNRQEQAIPLYERLIADFPKKTDLPFQLVELYMDSGRNDEALALLDQVELAVGRNDVTVLTRFNILLRQRRQQDAYDMLEAYNEEESSPQVLAMLGEYNASLGRDSTAIALYDEALSLAPGYPGAIVGKAEVCRISRRYDEFFSTVRPFLADSSIPSAGKVDYLNAVLRQGDPRVLRVFGERVDSLVDLTVETHRADTSVLTMACIYYYGTSRREKSLALAQSNIEACPEAVQPRRLHCQLLYEMNSLDSLAATGLRYADLFPDEPVFTDFAAYACYNLKEYPKLIAIHRRQYESAESGHDVAGMVRALSGIGDVLHATGEWKAAYKAYDKALRLDPAYVPVLNNYAYFLSEQRRKLKKAYQMSRKAIEAEPDNATYLDTFGWILYLQKKYPEAKPIFKQAMLHGGKESAVILDHYAEVLYALGEYDLASVYWKQAKARNSDGEIPDLTERVAAREAAVEDKR